MKIEARSLRSCNVVNGGDRISLGLVDEDGRDIEIKVSTADACAITMTLPQLLKASLVEKYQDASLRYVVPLEAWKVETASDGIQLILTFATEDGFEVSFVARREACSSLGSALSRSADREAVPTASARN